MLDQVHNRPISTVYAAIELSKKSWVVAIMHPAKGQPSIHRIKAGALADLLVKLRAATRNGERLLVCYEAGYDGFWLARSLQAEGVECRVLDPASLQVNRRARRGCSCERSWPSTAATGMFAPSFAFHPSRKKTHAVRIVNANGW